MEISQLFPETKNIKPMNCHQFPLTIWFCSLILLIGAAGLCKAQEPLYKPYEDPLKKDEFLDLEQIREPGSISPEEEVAGLGETNTYGQTTSRGAQSFRDDVFLNRRNRFGFALNVFQGYTEDISDRNPENQSSGITSATGRAFVNLGQRRSRLHLDFGAGYRRYLSNSETDNQDYHAGLSYSYQLARRTSFQVNDQFTSSYNDTWPFTSMYSPLSYNSGFSNEVIFNRQRITRNVLRAQLSHEIGRRISLGIFGGYDYYAYPESALVDSYAFKAGGNFNIRLTGWLYLTNSYATYLNEVDEKFRDARIHRLQVGGVDFRLSRAWRLWASGGAEYSDYQNRSHVAESVDAGIGYTSLNTAFSLTYRRGFTTAIGISRLFQSDIGRVAFGYRMTDWVNSRLEGYYYRNTDQSDYGTMESYSAGGGLEFSLCSYLQLTLNGFYQRQQTGNFSVEGLEIERLTAYLGLQFVWPGRSRTDRH